MRHLRQHSQCPSCLLFELPLLQPRASYCIITKNDSRPRKFLLCSPEQAIVQMSTYSIHAESASFQGECSSAKCCTCSCRSITQCVKHSSGKASRLACFGLQVHGRWSQAPTLPVVHSSLWTPFPGWPLLQPLDDPGSCAAPAFHRLTGTSSAGRTPILGPERIAMRQ